MGIVVQLFEMQLLTLERKPSEGFEPTQKANDIKATKASVLIIILTIALAEK